MVKVEIDGREVEVQHGATVMDAAHKLGIYVPHFCYHKKLSIAANCRMCLVEVEKAPKPLPACATPVTDGMKVKTASANAKKAQNAVMEFLLINHPLDCPICDQGGECQLQDLAVGYGGSASRYSEPKRVVPRKDIGPLVAAEEMSRCIHCTRCVRFGQEVAGVMELGMAGRGEHSEILSFVGRTVDSELSGNMIDLCPVGALTSKPFRFSARTWELTRRKSISPHCALGSNLVVQIKHDRVLRVLPLENEEINECWLSDKDRFSYEGLNAPSRLTAPMIRHDGKWEAVAWPVALEAVAQGLKRVRDQHGPQAIGALATPHSTFEELYLLGKLVRGIGSGNVDFRLRQSDFGSDGQVPGAPWLGMRISEINSLDRVLVVGSDLRKDHPLIAARLRQGARKGTQVSIVHSVADDWRIALRSKLVVAPSALTDGLLQVVRALAETKRAPVAEWLAQASAQVSVGEPARRIAESLESGQNGAVLLGNFAQHHPQAAELHAIGAEIARLAGARVGFLGEAANSVGGYLAGAVPFAQPAGLNARDMLAQPRKAYLLFNTEVELDCHDGRQALAAMQAAQFVVAMSPFMHKAMEYAHVLLPIAPFTETAGSFVNTEGRLQSFNGVVKPLAETRPGWKVLRVLGNLMGAAGFEFASAEEVRAEALQAGDIQARLSNVAPAVQLSALSAPSGIQRIGEVTIYRADGIVRRAESLQRTHDAQAPRATMPGSLMQRLGLRDGDHVRVTQGAGEAVLPVVRDDRLPADCVRIPAADPVTAALGAMFGTLALARVSAQQEVTA